MLPALFVGDHINLTSYPLHQLDHDVTVKCYLCGFSKMDIEFIQ